MTKRRELVRLLEHAGFREDGGTKHTRFIRPVDGKMVRVPRHREIPNELAQVILRQAGLR